MGERDARMDDGKGKDDDGERIKVEREGVPDDPADQAHRRQHKNCDLRN